MAFVYFWGLRAKDAILVWVLMGQTRQWCEASDVSSGAQPCARPIGLLLVVVWIFVAWTWTLAGIGCGGGSSTASGLDAAVDRDQTGDDANFISLIMPSCQTASRICDRANVRSCIDHEPGDILLACAGATPRCSLGRCTTMACAVVEGQDGVRGCRFYGVQMDNIDEDDGRNLMLLLSNATVVPVSATVEARDTNNDWIPVAEAVVPAGGGTRIELLRPIRESGVTPAGAFRVETTGPVMAVQVVSDDADRKSHSSGGTVLRPEQSIGLRYLAMTSPGDASATIRGTPGSRAGAATITVIATVDDTHVQVALTAAAAGEPGGILDPPPLSYDVPPMKEGDVFQVFSAVPGGDLTGTSISADFPVAVFSGNIFTEYGVDVPGAHGGDLASEQLPPTASWGMEYIGARLSPQVGCDPFFGPGVALWRVIAADPDTEVTISPAPGVSVSGPNLAADLKVRLGRGGFQSFQTRGDPNAAIPPDLVVTGSGPILLAQWLDCEPSLSWGIDSRLSRQDIVLKLPPGFDHEVVVVRQAGEPVTLDGRRIVDARFRLASQARGTEVARLGFADLGPCDDEFDSCEHRLSGSAIGVTWRGMDVVCSYAVTVPPGGSCAIPNVPCPN